MTRLRPRTTLSPAAKLLLALSTFASMPAFANHEEYDAFLSSPVRRAGPERNRLTRQGKQAFDQSRISSLEPRFGVPKFLTIWRDRGVRTPRDQGVTAIQAARQHLARFAELYQDSPAHIADLPVELVHDLHDGSAVIVTFGQSVDGVRVFRNEVRVVMTAAYEPIAISSFLTPARAPLGHFRLSAETAVRTAYTDLTTHGLEADAVKQLTGDNGYLRFSVTDQAQPDEAQPARAKNVWYAMPQGLIPAVYVEVNASNGTDSDLFAYVVSANDGAVLYRHSLKAYDAYSYRVWADDSNDHFPVDGPKGSTTTPHPTGMPDRFNPPDVAPILVTLDHGPISTGDSWLTAGATGTQGNNVKAYADLKAPDGFSPGTGDIMPAPVAANSFDYTYDLTLAPNANVAQQNAAVQSMFYITNFLHDWYYDIGFDEKSRNAQADNLGRGGQAHDPLLAEGQDYSGTNNANMATPADGSSPRMQMYTWSGAGDATLNFNGNNITLGTASFGPKAFDVTGVTELVDDQNTTTPAGSTATDGCTPIKNDVRGKIALIDRGLCKFVTKAQMAQSAGAIAVIIMDNVFDTTPPGMGGTGGVNIPVVSTTQLDGQTLQNNVGSTVSIHRAATVNPDGTIDNSVIGHEWGHYISNRLVGNANGLANVQGTGMGEGWADFHSMLLVVRAEDAQVPSNANWNGTYGLAAYAGQSFSAAVYYYGIRRQPYSADMTKNGLTLKHIQPGVALPDGIPTSFGQDGANNDEVHNTGEVWATMLWECYVSLLRDQRFAADFVGARERMRKYIVAAYKATPDLPTFTDARDAVLAVASADDTDYGLFWHAFAKRGNGMGAIAPPSESNNNTPVTESFLVGNDVAVTTLSLDDSSTSCDHDGNLDANEAGIATVVVKNVGIGPLSNAKLTISSNITGLGFPMGTTVDVPALDRFASATLKLPVTLGNVAGVQRGALTVSIADASLVQSPVVKDAPVVLNFDVRPAASQVDTVESPMTLWSTSADMTEDLSTPFRVFEETAYSHWWYGQSSSFRSDTYLVSPPVQPAPSTNFTLTFKHRFDFEQGQDSNGNTVNFDGAVVELSTDDGATWVDIGGMAQPAYTGPINANTGDKQSKNTLDGKNGFIGTSAGYPSWIAEKISLGTQYGGQTVKVRFHLATDDSLALGKGWEVDDIGFAGILTTPFPTVVSDPNTCTNHAPVVTIGPDQTVNAGDMVTLTETATDADNDPLTITWTQRTGPTVTLTGTTFTAPNVRLDTPVIFDLTVSDGRALVGPLSVTINVKTTNRAPTVKVAQSKLDAVAAQPLTLEATGTDPDGDNVTYAWTQLDGPMGTFADASQGKTTWTPPKQDEDKTTATLQVVASDGALVSEPVTVTVTIHKTACGCSAGLENGVLTVLGLAVLSLRRRRNR